MAESTHDRIRVAASPGRCWDVATDYERYPDWARDVKHAKVLERDDEGRATRVEYRVGGLGRSIHYVLGYDYAEAPRAFVWHLLGGDVLRRLDGRYAFEPDDGATCVVYDLTVELALPMPGVVKRRAAGLIVGAALRDLKREAEGA